MISKRRPQARVRRDQAFRRALLREGIECMLEGDIETGKAVLRDFVNATVGFERLGTKTRIQPKSLIRMFGPRGNPQARNLFDVVAFLQKEALERRIESALIAPRLSSASLRRCYFPGT